MRFAASMLLLALVGCSQGQDSAPEQPEVGRAVRCTLPGTTEEFTWDVAEVDGERVRLRRPLCEPEDPGVWVDWSAVANWRDAGPAVGDASFLGLPPDFGYGDEE